MDGETKMVRPVYVYVGWSMLDSDSDEVDDEESKDNEEAKTKAEDEADDKDEET